jgi:hypothetical protein
MKPEPLDSLWQDAIEEIHLGHASLLSSFRRLVSVDMIETLGESESGRERLEAFCARFARLSDILLARAFRLADERELLPSGTVIDRLHRAEKRQWISSAHLWQEIRLLRNRMAHEYAAQIWAQIVQEAWRLTPEVLRSAEALLHANERTRL